MFKNDDQTADHYYGKILFDAAIEEGKLDEVHDEVLSLREIYKDAPELGDFLSDDWVEPFEKMEVLRELESHFNNTVSNFLRILYEYGRMKDLRQIIDEFMHFYYDSKGILFAKVTSVVELNEQQVEKLKSKVAEIHGYKSVELKQVIDPEILGGLIVQANYKVIDNSVRRQLASIGNELVQ